MTLSFQIIAAGVAVLLLGVLGVLLVLPTEETKRPRPQKQPPAPGQEQSKDWQAVSLKLERHIQALRKEIVEYQKTKTALEKDLAIQTQKYNKLHEKLAQERDWQKKEEDDIQKKTNEILSLKNDVRKIEHDLNTAHSDRLRFERELRESKLEKDSLAQVRRNLELHVQKIEAENDVLRKQVKELRWETERLSEKKDAESWVPKEDFQKLVEDLRDKEKELARVREQLRN